MSKKINEQTYLPPFYFIVVFWGKVHRDYFLDLLLASLLSPNNIPALNSTKQNKFVIATTEDDWKELQTASLFQLMKTYLEPLFIKMDFPDPTASKMLVMSHGHKLASEAAFNAKAIGVFVTPDLVLSDGSVAAMQRLAAEGKKVVLCAAIRFEHYGCMEGFRKLNVLQPNNPMNITGRQLMSVALNNLHSETIRYLWDSNHFAECPVTCLWPSSDKSAYVVHTFSWAPLVLNYAALTSHDTRTFEEWTLDGDYVYKNFGDNKDVYIVTDSDEIALVSFTKEEDLHIPAVPDPKQDKKILGTCLKMHYIYRLYHNPAIIDPLKMRLFLYTVYFHSNGINFSLRKTSDRAKKIVKFSTKFNVEKILTWYAQYMIFKQGCVRFYNEVKAGNVQSICNKIDDILITKKWYLFIKPPLRWVKKTLFIKLINFLQFFILIFIAIRTRNFQTFHYRMNQKFSGKLWYDILINSLRYIKRIFYTKPRKIIRFSMDISNCLRIGDFQSAHYRMNQKFQGRKWYDSAINCLRWVKWKIIKRTAAREKN